MQAEYRKEWMDTYLWVLAEKEPKEEYAEQMLLHNQGEGRLEFTKQQEGTEAYYCYKITGKKALNGIYAMMSIGEHQIRKILRQIFGTLDKGKEYLLNENDFVLLPNYIFATLPKIEIELCYVPGYNVPLKEQLESLFEYFLNRVDYEDKKAVELLYDCYMFCVKEQGGITEIRERIERETGENTIPKEPAIEKELPGRREEKTEWEEDEPEKQAVEAGGSYVTWLTDRFFHKKKREALLVAEQREEYKAEKQMELPKWEEKTMFLSGATAPKQAQLTNEATGEVFSLVKLPFYIGSVENYADCVLKEQGVSRIHCCINKKEENYYLSDLNSTNGTYLDGREVMPGKEERLWDGAVIRIAKTEFYVNLPCH